ncbi:hypothetical protein EXS70_04330 [Candidatus Peribacteria bacterium]|nr:hypothetical protein [Candidatus Peribacteria bacterium]
MTYRSALVLAAIFLASCAAKPPAAPLEAVDEPPPPASSSAPAMAMAEGLLRPAGNGITMEGSHRLLTDVGQELLLKSATIQLNDYVDGKVRVSGSVRPSVENSMMLMDVETIERVLPTSASGSTVSASSLSSSSSEAASSAMSSSEAPSSSSVPASSSSLAASSSKQPVSSAKPAASSAAAASSSVGSTVDVSASVKAMAKATVNSANFTSQYCTSHIGFCVPYHRNWYHQSFGALSPSLWHVEIADHEMDEAGQGVIKVDLVSGALTGAEGVAVEQGTTVVASRQWTGNRHFEISGPVELKAAVEFMANGLGVAGE